MNAYVALAIAIAIAGEVIAITAVTSSDSFTKLVPFIVTVMGCGVTLYFLTLTMKTILTGAAYSIWSAWALCSLKSSLALFEVKKLTR